MRLTLVLLAIAGLTACDRNEKSEASTVLPVVAFDGAQALDAKARIAHGRRLTRALGCTGCHGKELQGKRFYELFASNLTRDVPDYSDRQLEQLLRDGVHPTGSDVWGMPSEIFQHLSEADMRALIAYLRTLEPAGKPDETRLPFEPETKKLIAQGVIKPAADFVREAKAKAPVDLGPSHALGRYITRVTCAECHGPELKGSEGETPDLIVAGAYSREEFERLLTEGVPTGDRKLGELMTNVAKERFSQLTPHEREAVYAYLKARAGRPQPPQ